MPPRRPDSSLLVQRFADLQNAVDEIKLLVRDNAEPAANMPYERERLRADLAAHRQHLAEYSQALLALEEMVVGHEWMQSTFRAFPSEILRSIFIHVLSPSVVTIGEPQPIPHLRLAHVCARWRLEVFSHPPFWESISWSLGSGAGSQHLLDMILPLSHSLPLTLQISSKSESNIDIAQTVTGMRTLVAHCSRWKSFTVFISRASFASILDGSGCLALLQGHVPLLQKLDLAFYSMPGEQDIPLPVVNMFAASPALRQVSLGARMSSLDAIDIPWLQLERLSLHNATCREAHQICLAAKNLNRFTFNDYPGRHQDMDITFTPDPGSVHLITTLQVTVPAWEEQLAFLDALTLPALEVVGVGCGDQDASFSPFPLFRIQNLIERSGASIKHLSLQNLPIPVDELISFFRVIPSLELLSLAQYLSVPGSAAIMDQPLFDALAAHRTENGELDESKTLLPNLFDISILALLEDTLFPYDAFINLVSSRWDYVDEHLDEACETDSTLPFREFYSVNLVVANQAGFTDVHRAEIQRLRDDGMDFVVETGFEQGERVKMILGKLE